jgi:HK97 family phage prohead protease
MSQHSLLKHYAQYPGKIISSNTDRPLIKHVPSSRQVLTIADAEKLAAPQARQKWLKAATSDVDRTGDVMLMRGLDLTNFLKNPQFLWQHGLTNQPVHTLGKIVGTHVTENALYVLAEYAEAETYQFAEQIMKLDKAGYLPANSIGFHPIEWEKNADGGLTFTKWELVEVSKVELPMNPNAVDGKGYVDEGQIDFYIDLDVNNADNWIETGMLDGTKIC